MAPVRVRDRASRQFARLRGRGGSLAASRRARTAAAAVAGATAVAGYRLQRTRKARRDREA